MQTCRRSWTEMPNLNMSNQVASEFPWSRRCFEMFRRGWGLIVMGGCLTGFDSETPQVFLVTGTSEDRWWYAGIGVSRPGCPHEYLINCNLAIDCTLILSFIFKNHHLVTSFPFFWYPIWFHILRCYVFEPRRKLKDEEVQKKKDEEASRQLSDQNQPDCFCWEPPCLKLTGHSPWKSMVGRWNSSGIAYFQGLC